MAAATEVKIEVTDKVGIEEYLIVMEGSGLDGRRPYADRDRVGLVLANSGPIVTARTGEGELIGVVRSISDGGFATYLCDLAVVEAYQGQGLARAMMESLRDACARTILIVSAAPDVDPIYDHLGLRQHHSTWYGLPEDLDGFPDPPQAT